MSRDSLPSGRARLHSRALSLAQPLSAILELTYRCNWRCVFCYNPRHFDRRRLSAAEWEVVLDDLRALGTLMVTLTGGEPLAHPEFLEIARAVRARAFVLKIFTNGTLIDEPVAGEIAALGPLAVEMSLHGACAETHDKTTGRPGSFEALLASVDRLQRHGVRLVLKTPLTRLNESQLDDMVELASQRGVTLRVDPTLTPRDDGDATPLTYRASPAGIEHVMRTVYSGAPPSVDRHAGGVNCGLGRVTLAVDPEGSVFPCIQWRRSSLGNVRETRLKDLWLPSQVRQEAAEVAQKANDMLLQMGGPLSRFPYCPALAHQHTGDPMTPDAGFVSRARIADRVWQTNG